MEEPGKAAGAWQDMGRGPSKPHCSKGSTSSALGSATASSPSQVTVTQRGWLEVTTVGSAGATSPLKQGHPKSLINPLTTSISPTPDSQLPGAHSAHPGGHRSLLLLRGANIKQGNNHTHKTAGTAGTAGTDGTLWTPPPWTTARRTPGAAPAQGAARLSQRSPQPVASQCHACPALGTGRQLQALTHESSSQER